MEYNNNNTYSSRREFWSQVYNSVSRSDNLYTRTDPNQPCNGRCVPCTGRCRISN